MCKQNPKEDQNNEKSQSKYQNTEEPNKSEPIPKDNQFLLDEYCQTQKCSIPRKMNKKISKTTRNSTNQDRDMNQKISTKISNKSCMRTPNNQKVDYCNDSKEKKCLTLEQFQINKKKQIKEKLGYHKRIEQVFNIIDKRIILTSNDPIIMLMKQDLKIPQYKKNGIFQQQQQQLSPIQQDPENNQAGSQEDSLLNQFDYILDSENQDSCLGEGTQGGFLPLSDDELDLYQVYFKNFVYSQEEMSTSMLREFIKKKKLLKSYEPKMQMLQAQLYHEYYHGFSQGQSSSSSPRSKKRVSGTTEKESNATGRQNQESDSKSEPESNKKKVESHICYHCWEIFENGFKLGGHTSKKHPGKSVEYFNKSRLQNKNYIDKLRRQYFQKISKPSKNNKQFSNDDPKLSSNSNKEKQIKEQVYQQDEPESKNRCRKKKMIRKIKPSKQEQKIIKRKTKNYEDEDEMGGGEFYVEKSRVIDLNDLRQNFDTKLENPLSIRQIQQQSILKKRNNHIEMEKSSIALTNQMQPEFEYNLDFWMNNGLPESRVNYEEIYNNSNWIEKAQFQPCTFFN